MYKLKIMKNLLLALSFMAVVPGIAAEKNDTTFQYRDKQIVVKIDSVETKIVLLDKNGNEYTKIKEESYVDGQEVERIFVSSPFVPIKKKSGHTFYGHFADFFIGQNLLNGGSEMHSRDAKSLEWGVTVFDIGLGLTKSDAFGLMSALQVGFVHNHFNTDYVLNNIGDKTTMVKNDTTGVKTSFLKYTYWKIPLIFEWKKKFAKRDAFIGIGVSMEWRTNIKSKYRIGDKRYTVSRELNVNPIGIDLEGYIGFAGFNIFAHYGLTKMFKDGPTCHPIGLGVGFTF